MAFDGVDHDGAALTYPIAYHPWAPLTGPALSNALEGAYMVARHSGQLMFSVLYPMTHRDPARQRDLPSVFSQTSYVRIADVYRYLPSQATHLVAEVIFSFEAPVESTANVRIVGTKLAGGSDTGAAVSTTSASARDLRIALRDAGLSPFGPRANTHTVRCEVAISTVQAGATIEVRVEAYAITVATSQAVAFRPQSVVGWWECRG